MIKFFNAGDFYKISDCKTFYVAFLQSQKGAWFPFSMVSSKEEGKLDTLCVSSSYTLLADLIKPYLEKLPSVKNYIIHLVYKEEIDNLINRYGFKYLGYLEEEENCGCGCGCH